MNSSGAFAVGRQTKIYFAVDPHRYTGGSYTHFRFVVSSPGQNLGLRFYHLVVNNATGAEVKSETRIYMAYELAVHIFNSPYVIDDTTNIFVVENVGEGSVATTIWWQ